MALAPRRARRLWAYWRAERRTLRQGFVALLLSTVAAFVAGAVLGSLTGTLERLPGLIIIIPAAVAQRGAIFGAMGARLGTSTHAGLFEATADRQGVLYQNVFVGAVLSLTLSMYLAILAKFSAIAFGLPSISILDFVTISVVGGALGSAVILGLTVGMAVLSYRRGYDLDAVSTPVVTAAADMLTIPTIFLATFLTRVEWLNSAVAGVSIAVSVYAAARGVLTRLPMARRVFAETVPVGLLTPVLGILAGTVIQARLPGFVANPGLLVLVPPLISNAGALGGVLSSRLSSKLQLGLISPRGRPEAPAVVDASLVVAFALVIFPIIGSLGLAFSAITGQGHPGAATMVAGALLAGLLATAVAIVFAYYIAILTARFGLDPDNHGVPIITSVIDLAGVVSFLLVLSVFGVAVHG